MGVVWREETKFMQTWTSAYLITYPAARGLPNHHESNQWVPSPSQQPAAAASGPRTDVDSFLTRCSLCQHTLQLCHIGLECCWGRNQSLSHPYRSTPLSTRLWTVWAWKQTRPPLSLFHPHSAWAKHSWGATQWHGEEGRGGEVLTLGWQTTDYWKGDNKWTPSLWNCELLTAEGWSSCQLKGGKSQI